MLNLIKRNFKRKFNIWTVISILGVVLVLLPSLHIFLDLFSDSTENWNHIKEYLLKEYIINSLILTTFTALFTVIIGVALAWVIVAYDFPLRKFFKWALILPMAIPANIGAYTYSGMLSYTGIIQTNLRKIGYIVNPKWFDIMSINGAIFIFTIFLFPYVYLVTKSFLGKQSSALVENARVLGKNSIEIFFQVVLPISKVSIIGGAILVILEVLGDFGVVSYFGINTFSTAIFTTWFGMYDLNSAIRLAGILMIAIIIILFLEELFRGRKRYSFSNSKVSPLKPEKLVGISKIIPTLFCSIVFLFSFLIPFTQLLIWGVQNYNKVLDTRFIKIIYNTILVTGISALIIIIFAIIIANFSRMSSGIVSKTFSKLILLGYSIPAAVIAVGVISIFIEVDKALWGKSSSLILSSSIIMLIFAFVIRYLGIGFNNVKSGFEKVGNKYLEASRLLGVGLTKSLVKIDLKLIRGSILSGLMLVVMDILKELPLTLILRPFNFETLATKTYQYANDENIQFAAVPALIIVFISIIAIYIINTSSRRKN